ncbi:MAG: translocation/assembly module TamB [Deltaproteobacteria bacterium]|nr:translocation/assembly module TamB [Deltaproteobacteria bacterium]
MARRWAWWTAGGLLLVVLLAFGAWRLTLEIPDRLREAEEAIRREAARYGLRVSFRNLRFHFLYPHVSLEDLEVIDLKAGTPLLRAGNVDVSLSPGRLLAGDSPVSRIRIRKFSLIAGEANRPVFDRLREGERKGSIPEILFLEGEARLGPFGPLTRWESKIREIRIRDVKFLGTRIFLKAEEGSGAIAVSGAESANWPLDSLETELFHQEGALRVRRMRASGPSISLKASGNMDLNRNTGDVKLSGALDLARWLSTGGPGSPWIRRFAEKGILDLSVDLSGRLEDPSGTGKLVLRDGRFSGDVAVELDLAASVANRKMRVDSLKGKVSGGTLAGNGVYDLDARTGEAKLSLARISLGTIRGNERGIAWRPSGTGDAEIALSADRRKVNGTLAVRFPGGLDRIEEGKRAGGIRLPVSAAATAEYRYGGDLRIAAARVVAGEAVLSGSGEIDPAERTIRFDGKLALPRGRSAEYGWDDPVSWASIAGEWKAAGPLTRPRVSMRLEARELQARSFPPVPLVVKLDGDPAEIVSFVADIPAPAAKVTATGSIASPLSSTHRALEAAVAVRDIDFSEGNRWIAGVLSSLGRDPSIVARHLPGLSGSGSADIEVSAGGNAVAINGSFRAAELRGRGAVLRDVSISGNWSDSEGRVAWKAAGGGKLGDGKIRMEGGGKNGSAELAGSMEGLDLRLAASIAAHGKAPAMEGTASVRFAARRSAGDWLLDRISAAVPRLSVDNSVLERVSAEGAMGTDSGRFSISVQTPPIQIAADVRRGGEWPASVTLTASGVDTQFLLAAAGRPGQASGGKWDIGAEGTVHAASLVSDRFSLPEAVSALRFSLAASSPSVAGVSFDKLLASGKNEGDAVTGEFRSAGPDSRLAFTVSLKEPHAFRMEGPFSFATAVEGKERGNGKTRYAVSGEANIAGALTAIGKTTGSLTVRRFDYRNGGLDFSGRDVSAQLSSDGVRWAGGTVLAAGNPVKISGKVSWKGDMDARIEGKLPAAAIRLATDVFDRLDGVMRLDLRLSGKWNDPSFVGSGRLDGGVFSFRGYGQLFEEMQVDAVLSREKIVFEHFEGRSGGGYIDGRGELPLRFDAHQRLFFSADFFDMRFPYPDDFRPVLQGHVELLGPYDDFLVTGEAEVQSARYTKTIRPEKALVDFRKRLADVTARRDKSDFRVRLDISAIADGTIKIKNNIADADVKGEFKVVGDASRVIILGAFDVIEGHVDYQGNRYELKRVSVEFQDPRRNNPRLDARAETKKGNVTAIVSVTGTLEKYEVDLSSDPPLSKNDIVSLLSLGVTSQALAGSEGTVGAAAASSVVLGPYKGKVEEGIRGIVKLDKFAIEPAFSSSTKTFEPKFIVGKSFGDRMSVSVSTNVGTTAESSATAEYKLLENVYLQGAWESATSTQQGDIGADIKFRYRYRQFKDFLRGRD